MPETSENEQREYGQLYTVAKRILTPLFRFGWRVKVLGLENVPVDGPAILCPNHTGRGHPLSLMAEGGWRTPLGDLNINEELARKLLHAFPALTDAPIVFTRICLYCDTHDGHFWIAPDPERNGLVVAAGDSGHGFKFAPLLGDLIADVVEGKNDPVLKKFRWRPEVRPGQQKEGARYLQEWL